MGSILELVRFSVLGIRRASAIVQGCKSFFLDNLGFEVGDLNDVISK